MRTGIARIVVIFYLLIVWLVHMLALYHFVILDMNPKDQTAHIIIALWLCTGLPFLMIFSVYLFDRLSGKRPPKGPAFPLWHAGDRRIRKALTRMVQGSRFSLSPWITYTRQR